MISWQTGNKTNKKEFLRKKYPLLFSVSSENGIVIYLMMKRKEEKKRGRRRVEIFREVGRREEEDDDWEIRQGDRWPEL